MANIKRLTELLENVVPFIDPKEFDMAFIHHDCGSPSCVGGFAQVHEPFLAERGLSPDSDVRNWQDFFGLDYDEARHIFSGSHPNDTGQAAQRIIDVIEANT